MIQVCLFPVFLFKEWMCDFKLPPIKIKSNDNFWSWGKTVPLDLSHEIGFAGLWCAGNSNIPQSCKANPTISGNVKKELFFFTKKGLQVCTKRFGCQKGILVQGPRFADFAFIMSNASESSERSACQSLAHGMLGIAHDCLSTSSEKLGSEIIGMSRCSFPEQTGIEKFGLVTRLVKKKLIIVKKYDSDSGYRLWDCLMTGHDNLLPTTDSHVR